MKKLGVYLSLFFGILIIQFGFSRYLAVAGVFPNLILVFLVFIALLRGSMMGQLLGFCWGLSWDVFSVDMFGIYAFAFTCLGYFMGLLHRRLDEFKVITQVIVTVAASIFLIVAKYFLYQTFGENDIKIQLNYINIIQPVLNVIIAPFVFNFVYIIFGHLDRDERIR